MIGTENQVKIEIQEKIAALMVLASEYKELVERYVKEKPDPAIDDRLWEIGQNLMLCGVQGDMFQALQIFTHRNDIEKIRNIR